jgi:hypothetical protein
MITKNIEMKQQSQVNSGDITFVILRRDLSEGRLSVTKEVDERVEQLRLRLRRE